MLLGWEKLGRRMGMEREIPKKIPFLGRMGEIWGVVGLGFVITDSEMVI